MPSLGVSLTDALDELIGDERIDPQLAMKVLTQFDRVIAETLQEKVKARLTFKVILPRCLLRLGKNVGVISQGGARSSTRLAFHATSKEEADAAVAKQGSLDTYRFCDEVWTFLIRNVTFKLDNGGQTVQADKVK